MRMRKYMYVYAYIYIKHKTCMGWRLAAGDSPKIRSVCNWAQWRMVTRAVTMVGRLVVNNAEMHTCYTYITDHRWHPMLAVFESLSSARNAGMHIVWAWHLACFVICN